MYNDTSDITTVLAGPHGVVISGFYCNENCEQSLRIPVTHLFSNTMEDPEVSIDTYTVQKVIGRVKKSDFKCELSTLLNIAQH